MPRVKIDDVKDIADFDALNNDELQAFITDASLIIDDEVAPHTSNTDRLALVEKYLAAHLAALKDQRVSKSVVGDSEFTYEGEAGSTAWTRTRYGQVAIALDPTGRLKAVPHHVETVKPD